MMRTRVVLATLAMTALGAFLTVGAAAEDRASSSPHPHKRPRPLTTGPNDFVRPPPGPERPYYRPPPEIAPPMERVPQVAPLSPRIGN
jgi:hypothetical protein